MPSTPADPGSSFLAYSPNTDEGLGFEQAYHRLKSSNQAAFRKMTDQVLRQTGHKDFQTHDAIGDWQDGAENSVLQIIHGQYDPDSLKYAAAWYGLLGNQKSVMAFYSDPSGSDSVYQIPVPDTDTARVRANLDRLGIKFRTLIPSPQGHLVVVADQGRLNRQAISKFAETYNAPIREAAGSLEFMGGDGSRASARHFFRSRIREYEATHHGPAAQAAAEPVRKGGSAVRNDTTGSAPRPVKKLGRIQAPAGGAVVRGLYLKGGEYLPKEAQPPKKRQPVRQASDGPFLALNRRSAPSGTGLDSEDDNDYYPGHPKHPRTKSLSNPDLK